MGSSERRWGGGATVGVGGAPETLDSVALKLRHIRWEFASRCDASPPDFWDGSAESLTERFRNIYVRVAVGQTPCADDGTRLSVAVVNTSTCSTCPFSGNRETEKAHPNRTCPDESRTDSHMFSSLQILICVTGINPLLGTPCHGSKWLIFTDRRS